MLRLLSTKYIEIIFLDHLRKSLVAIYTLQKDKKKTHTRKDTHSILNISAIVFSSSVFFFSYDFFFFIFFFSKNNPLFILTENPSYLFICLKKKKAKNLHKYKNESYNGNNVSNNSNKMENRRCQIKTRNFTLKKKSFGRQ